METREETKPRTLNRRLASVRAFSKFAQLGDILHDFKAPTPQKSQPHPIEEGVKGVVAMCESTQNAYLRALFALEGLLGLRISEALSMKPEHFDIENMSMTVRGKGDKTRIVPISTTAWLYIDPAYTLARQQGGKLVKMSDRGARLAITRTANELGFSKKVSSHDLRATCATAHHNKTGNIRATQELLGHASSHTTETYTLVTEKTIRDGLEFDLELEPTESA